MQTAVSIRVWLVICGRKVAIIYFDGLKFPVGRSATSMTTLALWLNLIKVSKYVSTDFEEELVLLQLQGLNL